MTSRLVRSPWVRRNSEGRSSAGAQFWSASSSADCPTKARALLLQLPPRRRFGTLGAPSSLADCGPAIRLLTEFYWDDSPSFTGGTAVPDQGCIRTPIKPESLVPVDFDHTQRYAHIRPPRRCVRRPQHSRECRRTCRSRRPRYPGVGRRPTRRHACADLLRSTRRPARLSRKDCHGRRLPVVRRGRVHHRPDPHHRRWLYRTPLNRSTTLMDHRSFEGLGTCNRMRRLGQRQRSLLMPDSIMHS